VLAYHIREGAYGNIRLDGLNVLAVSQFEGNIWAGEARLTLGLYIDERADEGQRDALQRVFSGQAGGFMATFAELIGEVRGLQYVPITFEVAVDLAYWRAEIPGQVVAAAEALSGPTTPPGARVQLLNPRDPKWVRGRWRPGARPRPTRWRLMDSNGIGLASPVNIFPLTGPALCKTAVWRTAQTLNGVDAGGSS
jgi:hypothetical protein